MCLLGGCKSVKMDSPQTATKLVEFSKSPCYGKCPSFSLLIMTDGSMEYIGKRNVERVGPYTKQLDAETYKKIYVALKNEGLYQYDDVYDKDTQDGSKTRIVYYGDEGRKAFGTMFTFPGNTQEIANSLLAIADDKNGWAPKEEMIKDENVVKNDEPIRKILSYNQGACFGQCPSFSIDVFSDGKMLYVGKSYAKLTGIHEKNIGENDLNEILGLVQSEAFNTVNTREDERIMDAQTFKMIYYESPTERKEVKWKINDAEVLENIKSFFKDQAESRAWKEKKKDDSADVDFDNTLIVSLTPAVQPKDWILTQRHIDAKIVKFLSPNMTYFIMSFNPELNKDAVTNELKKNKSVLNVQAGNRPAKPRGGTPQSRQSGEKATKDLRGGNDR